MKQLGLLRFPQFVQKTKNPSRTLGYGVFKQQFHRLSTYEKRSRSPIKWGSKTQNKKTADNINYVSFGPFSAIKACLRTALLLIALISLISFLLLFLLFYSSYITPPCWGLSRSNYVNKSEIDHHPEGVTKFVISPVLHRVSTFFGFLRRSRSIRYVSRGFNNVGYWRRCGLQAGRSPDKPCWV